MVSENRTEKPTEQRIRKARREGRFAVSKEAVYAVQFSVFVAVVIGSAPVWFQQHLGLLRGLLAGSFRTDLTSETLKEVLFRSAAPLAWSLLLAGATIWSGGLLVQMCLTGFGLAGARVTPDLSRLNPTQRLRELPGNNLTALLEAVVLLPVLAVALYVVFSNHAEGLLTLPAVPVRQGVVQAAECLKDLLWKALLVFVMFGVWDVFRQRQRYQKSLRMTKQEIREEYKENEGDPQIKARIRRLRRDLLRRRMMAEVPTATAVIVNPTHFAVALRYDSTSSGAPLVVAKGKNWLAARIRQIANQHQIPIVENPPLAQALYKTVEVGQEIPPHLYRAVAEILAYLYRLMGGRLPNQGGERI